MAAANTSELVGLGLYSIQEASLYSGISSSAIRRWIQGYRDSHHRFHPALWTSPLMDNESELEAITFGDMLELRFVQAFRNHGVSLQAIRLAAEHAREYFNSPYPFTCHHFLTDGRRIFAEVEEETGDETIIDLSKKQSVFSSIVRPSLYRGIEYDSGGLASRWFPMARNKKVVLDPHIGFGKPITAISAIPTDVLYQAWLSESKDEQVIARIFEVPVSEVKAAIKFEQGLVHNREVLH